MSENDNSWEQNTINNMLEMTVKEQRARRRWGIFFKLTALVYVLGFTIVMLAPKSDLIKNVAGKSVTAVVYIDGEIGDDKDASADNLIPLISKAFANPAAKAVMLRINSPGGSPVQTRYIAAEIKHIRKDYPDKKLYAVIEDSGTSAAYWLACAADEIYADESSIVGSIGVVLSSFGFVDSMQKLGVERRLYTSGSNKGMLDPFSPAKPNEVAMLQTELDLLHDLFISMVKETRGARLVMTDDMFSGRIWLGIEAKKIGLIDGFGSPYSVARDVVGAPEMYDYEVHQSIFSQLKDSIASKAQALFTKAFVSLG